MVAETRKETPKNIYGISVFLLIGMIITFQSCDDIAHLIDVFSRQNTNRICLGLSIWLFASLAWLILKNDLNRHKKYLALYAPPDFDIDQEEECDISWNEAGKLNKYLKHW